MGKLSKCWGLLLLFGAVIILAAPLSAVLNKAETGYFWGDCTIISSEKKMIVTNVFTADWNESTSAIANQLYAYLAAQFPDDKFNRATVVVMGPYKEGDAYEKRNGSVGYYRSGGYEVIEVNFAYHSNCP